MKNLFLLFISVLFFQYPIFAKQNEIPDPLFLNSPVLDSSNSLPQKKEVDNRTINEKFREKFHLPPTKKIYYHNIDKSNQPVTMDDYYKIAADKKRKDFVVPKPIFTAENDIILPDPHYRVIRYNTPPGQRNIDLSSIVNTRTAKSPGILSPDKTKMVYTQANFYPEFSQTSSEAFFIPVSNQNDAYDALFMTNIIQQQMKPIVSSGFDSIQNYQFKTLFPIDWSKDSSKIAFKEKIGSNINQTWVTNVIIYDFNSHKAKKLTAVREAIIYWWRQNKQIDLKDYLWDIFPVGWDKNNPDRLIVYAYAFSSAKPLFLGTWSIDFNEEKSSLVSIDSTDVEIDLNGFGLKEIKFEH